MHKHLFCVLGIALAMTAGGCGGESDSTPAPTVSSAEGLWSGSTTTNRTIAGVVLDDGTYYFSIRLRPIPT